MRNSNIYKENAHIPGSRACLNRKSFTYIYIYLWATWYRTDTSLGGLNKWTDDHQGKQHALPIIPSPGIQQHAMTELKAVTESYKQTQYNLLEWTEKGPTNLRICRRMLYHYTSSHFIVTFFIHFLNKMIENDCFCDRIEKKRNGFVIAPAPLNSGPKWTAPNPRLLRLHLKKYVIVSLSTILTWYPDFIL